MFQLAEADASISMKEVRLLMYALKVTNIDFNDVAISHDLVASNSNSARGLSFDQ